MKQLIIKPNGWPCAYGDAPPGAILVGEQLCFKSEYRTAQGKIEGYNSAGEFLCIAETDTVQPVEAEWIDADQAAHDVERFERMIESRDQ